MLSEVSQLKNKQKAQKTELNTMPLKMMLKWLLRFRLLYLDHICVASKCCFGSTGYLSF